MWVKQDFRGCCSCTHSSPVSYLYMLEGVVVWACWFSCLFERSYVFLCVGLTCQCWCHVWWLRAWPKNVVYLQQTLCWSCSEATAHTWGLIFISLVCRRLLTYSFSYAASHWVWPGGNSVCLWRTCWYVLLTHVFLSVSWGGGICAFEVCLWYCHVQQQQIVFLPMMLPDTFHPTIHVTTVKLWSADT